MRDLTEKFISLCDEYAKGKSEVLGHKEVMGKKYCSCFIELPLVKLEFRYIKKSKALVQPNSLYCLVYLQKNSDLYYHLVDLMPYFKNRNFSCCYFSSIENEERLEKCFFALTDIIDSSLKEIEALALDDEPVKWALYDHYKRSFKLKENDVDFTRVHIKDGPDYEFLVHLQKSRDELMLFRFTGQGAYVELIKGNREKALKQFKKQHKKGDYLEYELQLADFLSTDEGRQFSFIPDDINSQLLVLKFNSVAPVLKAFFAVHIPVSVILCALFYFYNFTASKEALFIISPPWYLGVLCAAYCAIFSAIAFYGYMPNKKLTKEQLKNTREAVVSKSTKIFTFTAFAFSVIASLYFGIMMMSSDLRFYDDGVAYNCSDFWVMYYHLPYDRILDVYHIDARYNDDGERIERESYILLFEDGTTLDIDGYASIEESEETIIPFFEEKGFAVKNVDSNRDIPKIDFLGLSITE